MACFGVFRTRYKLCVQTQIEHLYLFFFFFHFLGKHAIDQERPYFCVFCDIRFSTRKRWEKHMPKHSAEAPFDCKDCFHLKALPQWGFGRMLWHVFLPPFPGWKGDISKDTEISFSPNHEVQLFEFSCLIRFFSIIFQGNTLLTRNGLTSVFFAISAFQPGNGGRNTCQSILQKPHLIAKTVAKPLNGNMP